MLILGMCPKDNTVKAVEEVAKLKDADTDLPTKQTLTGEKLYGDEREDAMREGDGIGGNRRKMSRKM